MLVTIFLKMLSSNIVSANEREQKYTIIKYVPTIRYYGSIRIIECTGGFLVYVCRTNTRKLGFQYLFVYDNGIINTILILRVSLVTKHKCPNIESYSEKSFS